MMSFNHFYVVTLIGKSENLKNCFSLSIQLQTAKTAQFTEVKLVIFNFWFQVK